MKTAKQAREAMDSIGIDPKTLPRYNEIEIAIEKAIARNLSKIYLNDHLDPRLMVHLTNLGYKCENGSDRNESVCSVSWER
jgi:hypothetical protein